MARVNTEIDQADKVRRVVVFGGTFDPPHVAHTSLPKLVVDALGADEVCYVPAGRSPFKLDHAQSSPEHRLAMLRLALAGVAHATIDTGEIERGDDGPSYTIDTVRRLNAQATEQTEFRLLIGTDQLFSFAKWREAEALAGLSPLAVLVRPPHDLAQARHWLGHAPAFLRGTTLIEAPALDVSSSAIRAAVRGGEDVSAWVSPAVMGYIREHGLYRGS